MYDLIVLFIGIIIIYKFYQNEVESGDQGVSDMHNYETKSVTNEREHWLKFASKRSFNAKSRNPSSLEEKDTKSDRVSFKMFFLLYFFSITSSCF